MRVGQTVCGRFELLREEAPATGSQIFGRTWVVLDGETGDVQRATFVDAELLTTEDAREAFVTHAGALTDVASPGGGNDIAPVMFAGREGDQCVVIYEALHGAIGLVDAFADPEHPPDDRRLELARFLDRIPRALGFLHRHRLVHGLLSTATVFSWDHGHALWQYALVPHLDRNCLLERHGGHCDGVLAPEVREGGPFTPTSDVYAWGAALAHWITGKPFSKAIKRARAGKLPGVSSPELVALIGETLAEDPTDRPTDGEALQARLTALGLHDEEAQRPVEALIDALAGVGDHVYEPDPKSVRTPQSPSASSSALELPVTNLEDLAEPSRPHAAASHAALVMQFQADEATSPAQTPGPTAEGSQARMAQPATSQAPGSGTQPAKSESARLPTQREPNSVSAVGSSSPRSKSAPQAATSGARQVLVLEKRVFPAEVPLAQGDDNTKPGELQEPSLAETVASAVEQGAAALELRDNVNAALAGGADAADELSEPPERLTASVDGTLRRRADDDAPMAVRRHRSRATYPLGHTAIPDDVETPPASDVSVEAEVGDDTNPELASAEAVEKPAERYVNLIVAVVGGLTVAYLLMTWLRQ